MRGHGRASLPRSLPRGAARVTRATLPPCPRPPRGCPIPSSSSSSSSSPGDAVRFSVTHADLEQCVGLATAAFALEVIRPEGSVPAGVHYAAELPPAARRAILDRVRAEAALWEFEVTPAGEAPAGAGGERRQPRG